MDALYSGVGGAAGNRRRFANPPVVAAAVTETPVAAVVSSALPVLRTVAPRFATFEQLGISVPLAAPAPAPVPARVATDSRPRFATFAELGMATPLAAKPSAALAAAASVATASRFVTFAELGATSDAYGCYPHKPAKKQQTWTGKKGSVRPPMAAASDSDVSSDEEASDGPALPTVGKSAGDVRRMSPAAAEASTAAVRTKTTARRATSLVAAGSAPAAPASGVKSVFDMANGECVDWQATGDGYAGLFSGIAKAGKKLRSKSKSRGKSRSKSRSKSKKGRRSSDSSGSDFSDDEIARGRKDKERARGFGEAIDARSLALSPPALVTGDAYAFSIKGIKQAIKGARGKVSKGGPALVSFSATEELGRQGLSDAQVAMIAALQTSTIRADGQLSALADRAEYEAILPVGAAQKLSFWYAGKKLIPTTVSRAARKYRVAADKPLAGLKVVHIGGLQNVASKRDLFVKSVRKEDAIKRTEVYKGAPITIAFTNALNGRSKSVTMDNVVEVAATGAGVTNARLWYAPLDSATGPALVIMRFADTSFWARLTDVLFVYAAEVDLKSNGAALALLASEQAIAVRFGALVDEMVVAGYEQSFDSGHLLEATGDAQQVADADMDTFKQVLSALQSLVACPAETDLAAADRSALATYMGALTACVHAHMVELHGEVDTDSPIGMVAEGDAITVQSDETRAASADMAHAMGELAGDLVSLGLDSHSIAIRAGHLYETIFENLQCGREIAGHLGEDGAFANNADSVNAAHLVEADISHLALLSLAHVLGNVANKSGHADAIDALWTGASETAEADYETLLATHFG